MGKSGKRGRKSFRKSPTSYVGEKIEQYSSDGRLAMGPTASFVSAVLKGSSIGYEMNPRKYQVAIPLALSGETTDKPHVAVEFSDPMDLEGGKDIVMVSSEDMRSHLVIETDSSSAMYIDGNNTKIPAEGMFKLHVSSEIEDAGGKLKQISDEVAGIYDIPLTEETDEDAMDGSSVLIRAPLRWSKVEHKYDEFKLPRADLELLVDKDFRGDYILKKMCLSCNYDGEDMKPIGSCSPFVRDIKRDRRSPFASVLLPGRFKAGGPRCVDNKYGSFQQELEYQLKQELGDAEFSLVVSHAGQTLYQKDAQKRYAAGNVTQALTAITLLRTLRKKDLDWDDIRSNPSVVQAVLKDTKLADALKQVYASDSEKESLYVRLSSGQGEGPTVFQLLTHTAGLPDKLTIQPDELMKVFDRLPNAKYEGSEDEFSRTLFAQKLVFQPGTRVHPSDVGYAILGSIIKRLDGSSSAEQAILTTARQIGMKNCEFVTPGNAHKEFGPSKNVFASSNGVICSTSDLDNLLQAMQSDAEVIDGMKATIRPQYRFSEHSPAAQCMGWTASPCINDKHDSVRYTTIDACGHTGLGHGARATIVPEYGLNVSFAIKDVTGPQYSELSVKVLERVVNLYIDLVAKRQAPCKPIGACNLAQFPPLYSHNACAAPCKCPRAKCACKDNFCVRRCVKDKSFYRCHGSDGADAEPAKDGKILREMCQKKVKLVPLLGSCKLSDALYVVKRGEDAYALQFGENPDDKLTVIVNVVEDGHNGKLRIQIDETPSEHVFVHSSKTERGNPVWGISVWGDVYMCEPYVISRVGKLTKYIEQVQKSIQSDAYASVSHNEKFIGKSFVAPLLLGGIAGAALGGTAGYLAGRANPKGYNRYRDPYDGSYYGVNPGYTNPVWAGGYRQYPGWVWSPYYSWDPLLHRYVYRPRRRFLRPNKRYGRRPSKRFARRHTQRKRRARRNNRRNNRISTSIRDFKHITTHTPTPHTHHYS